MSEKALQWESTSPTPGEGSLLPEPPVSKVMFAPGDPVHLLSANPAVNGGYGRIAAVEDWGCHVSTPNTATGRYRAAFSELLPFGELNGHAPTPTPPAEIVRRHRGVTLADSQPPLSLADGMAALSDADDRRRAPRAKGKDLGYSGNVCSSCGGVRMKRTGVCETCEDCGTTSGGCS